MCIGIRLTLNDAAISTLLASTRYDNESHERAILQEVLRHLSDRWTAIIEELIVQGGNDHDPAVAFDSDDRLPFSVQILFKVSH